MADAKPPQKVAFAQLYYPQALAAMLGRKAEVLPLHTSTNPFDPLNAAIDVEATDHHGMAIAADLQIAEMSWPTISRRGSMVALGRLIGYRPARDVPATAYVVFDLSVVPDPLAVFLEPGALFGVSSVGRVRFEALEGIGIPGALDWTFEKLYDAGTDTFADWVGPVLFGDPWTVDDALYFGHPELFPDGLQLVLDPYGTSGDFAFLLEYFDDYTYRGAPDAIALSADGLSLEVEGIDWAYAGFTAGTFAATIESIRIRVTLKSTGVSEEVAANGLDKLVIGFLGQIAPSLNVNDYELSASWLPIPLTQVQDPAVDGGVIQYSFQLPDDTGLRRWKKTAIDEDTAYWLRLRLGQVTLPIGVKPEVTSLTVPSGTTWAGRLLARQGTTRTGVDLGASTGAAWQVFDVGGAEIVEGGIEAVYVDGTQWTGIENLYTAGPDDTVFEEEEDSITGRVRVRFGDGSTGAIPAQGLAITADVRSGAAVDGNVGALKIDRLVARAAGIRNVRNPMEATGWQAIEGGDPDNLLELERSRRRGPADYRAIGRGLTPDDLRYLLTDPRSSNGFLDRNGTRPVKRLGIILEGAGPKTFKLVCVGDNGTTLTPEQLVDMYVYLNGTERFLERFGGRLVANQLGDAINYTEEAKSFTITATVLASLISTAAGEAATKATIMAVLDKYVHPLGPPLATGAGDEWLWAIGEDISADLCRAAIAANLAGLVSLTLAINEGAAITQYGLPMHARTLTTIALVGI